MSCLGFVQGVVERICYGTSNVQHNRLRDLPSIALDTDFMGKDAVIIKNGRRLCGTGGALCNTPITQNKAYFEVKIQQDGLWGVGVATRNVDVNCLPLGRDGESLMLREDGKVYYNDEAVGLLPAPAVEGDVVGITFDHEFINFYVDGEFTNCSVSSPRGKCFYPALYVDKSSICDAIFADFHSPAPPGFHPLMIEQTIL